MPVTAREEFSAARDESLPAWLVEQPETGTSAARNSSAVFLAQLRQLYQRSLRAREMAATHTHGALDPCPVLGEAEESWDLLPSSSLGDEGSPGPFSRQARSMGPGGGQPSAVPMDQPPACSFLTPGICMKGTQRLTQLGARRRDEDWRVDVRLQEVDLEKGTLSGTMEAMNVPGAKQPIATYFDGHIIDNVNHRFITGSWGAGRENDMRHWGKFEGFNSIRGQVVQHQGRCPDLPSHPYIYMRWKERCFLNNCQDCGLTIAGFYYIQLNRQTGRLRGLYYDPSSSPFQELELCVQQAPLGGFGFDASSLR